MKLRRRVVLAVVVLTVSATWAAPGLDQATVNSAVTAISATLAKAGPQDKVPPTAALLVLGSALIEKDQARLTQGKLLLRRAAAGLDNSTGSQAVKLYLYSVGTMLTADADLRALAQPLGTTLAAISLPATDDQLGANSLVVAALATGGRVLAKPEWIDAAVAKANATILAAGADGKPKLLTAKGLRQEAYAMACLALTSLAEAGKPQEAVGELLTAMHTLYGAADGTYLAEPGGRPSLRDGRAPSGNASAAFALASYAQHSKDASAMPAVRKLLEAVLPQIEATPEYAGLWTAALAYLAAGVDAPTPPTPPVTPPITPAAGPADAGREVSVAAALAAPLEPGKDAVIDVTLTMTDPWHTYSHEPGNENVVPTEITATLPAGFAVKGIEYPAGEDFVAAGDKVKVYRDKVVIKVTISTPATLPAGAAAQLSARVQACDDRSCLRPASLKAVVALK